MSDGERQLAADGFPDTEIIPAAWEEGSTLNRLGVFASGKVVIGDKDETDTADGYDFHTAGLTIGADYRITSQFVVGAAFAYSHYKADFDNTPRSPNGQDLDSDTVGGSLFGTYFLDSSIFVDGMRTLGWSDFDSTRKIFIPNNSDDPSTLNGEDVSRTAKGSFDVFQYSLAARVGYDYTPEQAKALTVTPIAGVQYLRAEIDGFDEKGAAGLNYAFDDYTAKSLTSNLGVTASYAFSTSVGVITPSVRGSWVHEFEDDPEGPKVAYLNDPTGLSTFRIATDSVSANYGVLGASVAGQLGDGWAAFVDYATPVGLDDFTVHEFHFGLRRDF